MSSSQNMHVPFRSSAVTNLLNESFGAKCSTLFIACISPLENLRAECLDILKTAQKIKMIQKRDLRDAKTHNREQELEAENIMLKDLVSRYETELGYKLQPDPSVMKEFLNIKNPADDTVVLLKRFQLPPRVKFFTERKSVKKVFDFFANKQRSTLNQTFPSIQQEHLPNNEISNYLHQRNLEYHEKAHKNSSIPDIYRRLPLFKNNFEQIEKYDVTDPQINITPQHIKEEIIEVPAIKPENSSPVINDLSAIKNEDNGPEVDTNNPTVAETDGKIYPEGEFLGKKKELSSRQIFHIFISMGATIFSLFILWVTFMSLYFVQKYSSSDQYKMNNTSSQLSTSQNIPYISATYSGDIPYPTIVQFPDYTHSATKYSKILISNPLLSHGYKNMGLSSDKTPEVKTFSHIALSNTHVITITSSFQIPLITTVTLPQTITVTIPCLVSPPSSYLTILSSPSLLPEILILYVGPLVKAGSIPASICDDYGVCNASLPQIVLNENLNTSNFAAISQYYNEDILKLDSSISGYSSSSADIIIKQVNDQISQIGCNQNFSASCNNSKLYYVSEKTMKLNLIGSGVVISNGTVTLASVGLLNPFLVSVGVVIVPGVNETYETFVVCIIGGYAILNQRSTNSTTVYLSRVLFLDRTSPTKSSETLTSQTQSKLLSTSFLGKSFYYKEVTTLFTSKSILSNIKTSASDKLTINTANAILYASPALLIEYPKIEQLTKSYTDIQNTIESKYVSRSIISQKYSEFFSYISCII